MTYSNRQVFAILNKEKTAILTKRALSSHEMVSTYTENDILYAIPNSNDPAAFEKTSDTEDTIRFFLTLEDAFKMAQALKEYKNDESNSMSDLVIVSYSVAVTSIDILVSDLEKPEHVQWLNQYESFLCLLGDEQCHTAKSYRKDDFSGYNLPSIEEGFHNWIKTNRVQGLGF